MKIVVDQGKLAQKLAAVSAVVPGKTTLSILSNVLFQADGSELPAAMDLVRLAMPRRVYTQSQGDYIVECLELIHAQREEITGLEICWEPPSLRHFTARLQPLS